MRLVPKLPYTDEQIVLNTVSQKPLLRASILVLLHSGLRISDAVQLGPGSIDGDLLKLRTAKTGTDVQIPLPGQVEALQSLSVCEGRWFWNPARTKLEKRIDNLRLSMNRQVYKPAKIDKGGFHRFRDTAAVHWLQAGLSVAEVATLLGNSVRIVERHYSPWVRSRQQKLEERVRSIFSVAGQPSMNSFGDTAGDSDSTALSSFTKN